MLDFRFIGDLLQPVMQSTSHRLGLTFNDYFLNTLHGRRDVSVSAPNHISYIFIQQPLY